MRVNFQQQYAPRDRIKIDLSSLRLKETYEKNKLKLMEQYATEPQMDMRTETFTTYFYGKKPLVEPVDQAIREDLTPQQRKKPYCQSARGDSRGWELGPSYHCEQFWRNDIQKVSAPTIAQ